MGTDNRRVKHDQLQVRILQFLENALPDAFLRPAAKATEDRIPLAKACGQVAPRRAGAVDPQHGVDKEAIVPGGYASVGGFSWEQMGDLSKLLVGDFMSSHNTKG